MGSRLQQVRLNARRDLHREVSVPALLIIGTKTPAPVNVRVHQKLDFVGDIPGIDGARFNDQTIHIRFWLDELDGVPPRNARVSVAEGDAYQLGEALEAHGQTIDVTAIRLSRADAAGLPLPA